MVVCHQRRIIRKCLLHTFTSLLCVQYISYIYTHLDIVWKKPMWFEILHFHIFWCGMTVICSNIVRWRIKFQSWIEFYLSTCNMWYHCTADTENIIPNIFISKLHIFQYVFDNFMPPRLLSTRFLTKLHIVYGRN